MEDKKWYVLHVGNRKEKEVEKALLKKGIEAVVPMENRIIRKGGKWIQKPYVLFEGYVFVHIRYNWALYYQMANTRYVLRMLGSYDDAEDSISDEFADKPKKKKDLIFEPIPLTKQEEKLFIRHQNLFLEPPVIKLYDDGSYEIISRVFRYLKVIKIDRHARKITFLTTIAGQKTTFTLSFIKADECPATKAE